MRKTLLFVAGVIIAVVVSSCKDNKETPLPAGGTVIDNRPVKIIKDDQTQIGDPMLIQEMTANQKAVIEQIGIEGELKNPQEIFSALFLSFETE